MKQLILVAVCAMLAIAIVSSSAKAIGLENYRIESIINEDNTIDNVIGIRFDSPVYHLDYMLDYKIYNLTTESEFDSTCQVKDNGKGSIVSCDFVGMTNEDNLLTLRFQTKDTVKKVNDAMQFVINYPVAFSIKNALIIIKLPPNAVLSGEDINQSIFPKDGEAITDGKRIMVFWSKNNLEPGQNLQFSVLYSLPAVRGPFFEAVIVGMTMLIILTMIGIAFYIRRTPPAIPTKEEEITKTEQIVSSILNQDEKKILDVIKAHEGNVIQRVIVRETEFSKAKVSRLIKNLKDRNLVDVEALGRKNRVTLKTQNFEKQPERNGQSQSQQPQQEQNSQADQNGKI